MKDTLRSQTVTHVHEHIQNANNSSAEAGAAARPAHLPRMLTAIDRRLLSLSSFMMVRTHS